MPTACDGTETLAVRVMDYDWGKRDDMLGECVVRLGELMSQTILAGGQPVSMPLYRKGRGGEFGEVTLSAARGAAGLVVLRCHQATGLRKGDWFGKNDVYVQAYVVHRTADPSADAGDLARLSGELAETLGPVIAARARETGVAQRPASLE